MIIGIDGNEANIDNRVGVGQYAYNVLLNIHKLNKEHQYIIFLKEKPKEDLPKSNKNWQYKVIGPKKLWSRFALPLHLLTQSKKINLFFSLSHYSPLFSPCPTIPTIHDLGYLKFKDQFTKKDLYQLIKWTKQSIKKASHIITVSNFSKKEIQKIYKVKASDISIAYNGVDSPPKIDSKKEKKVLDSYNLETQKYFLYLGTLKPNKNIPFLIKSFSLFCKKELAKSNNKSFKLVIAGKKGWLFDKIFATVKEEGLTDRVIFTDYIDEQQKWILYKNAISLLLPSIYEGFGIPAIEAMKVGTPVIASNIPPLKEIIKNSGLFTDPTNQEDFCHQMIQIINPEIRQKYSKLGKIEADKFTWQKTAQSILETFNSLIK